MRLDSREQFVLRERLREVVLGSHDASASPVEQTVFRRQHDYRNRFENFVVLDERASLISVESRHHDVDEHDVGRVVGDLRERIETIDRGEDFAAFLREQGFCGLSNGLAVVDDEDFQTLEMWVRVVHRVPLLDKQNG